MAPTENLVAQNLESAAATPISHLSPELADQDSRVVRGEITITWPYNSVKRSLAFLLSESDIRLRRSRGQVRIQLNGPSAQSVASCNLGSGDEVILSLFGAEWAIDDSVQQLPGSRVEWQLKYAERLVLRIKSSLSDEIKVISIHDQASAGAPAPVAEAPLEPIVPESEPRPIQAVTSFLTQRVDADEFASPAFIRRAKVSYGSFFEGSFDDLLEEDGGVRGRGRKKLRFGRDSGAWRYNSTSRSPSLSDQDERLEQNVPAAEPQDEAHANPSYSHPPNPPSVLAADSSNSNPLPESSPVPALPYDLHNGGPAEPSTVQHGAPPPPSPPTPKPQMTDEGCQTSDLLASPGPAEPLTTIIGGQISDQLMPAASDLQPEQEHVLSSTSIPTQEAPSVDGLTKSSPPFGSSLFGSYVPSTTPGLVAAPFPTATSAIGFDPEISLGDQVRFGFAEPQDSLAFAPATTVQVSQPVPVSQPIPVPQPIPEPSSHYPDAYLHQPAAEAQLGLAADAAQSQAALDDRVLEAEPPPPPSANGSAGLDQVTVWPITTRTLDAEHAEGHIPLTSAVGASLQENDDVKSDSAPRTDIPREVDDYGHNERRYQNEAEEEMVGMDDGAGDNSYDHSGWESDAEAEYDQAEANTAGDDYDMRAYADVDDDEEGFEYPTGEADDYGDGEVFDDDGEGSYDEDGDDDDGEEEYDSEYGDDEEPQPMHLQSIRPQPAPIRSGAPVVIDLISDSEDESDAGGSPEMIPSNVFPIASAVAAPSSPAPAVSSAAGIHSQQRSQPSQTQVVDFGNMDGQEQRVPESPEADREDASPSYELQADGSEVDDESDRESDDEMGEDVEPDDLQMIDVDAQSSADEAEGSAADADGEAYDGDINIPTLEEHSVKDQTPEEVGEGSDVEVVFRHTNITIEVETQTVEAQLQSDATEHSIQDAPNSEVKDGTSIEEPSLIHENLPAHNVASSPAGSSTPQATTKDAQADSKSQDTSGDGLVGPSSPPLTQSFESQVPVENEIIVSSSPIASPEQQENADQLPTPFDTQPDGLMLSQQAILDSMEGEHARKSSEVPGSEQLQADVEKADMMDADAETGSPAVPEPDKSSKADEPEAVIHVAPAEEMQDDTEPPPPVSQDDDGQPVEDNVEPAVTDEPTEMELDQATQETLEPQEQDDGLVPNDDQGSEGKDEVSVNEVELVIPASQASEQMSEADGVGGASGEDAPKSRKKRGRKKVEDVSTKASTKASAKAPPADLSVELARASRRSTRQQKPETPKKAAAHTRNRSIQKTPTPEAPDTSFELAKASLQSPSKTVASLKAELGKRLRTDLPTYVNLQNLSYHLGKRLDVVAIATSDSTTPERTKTRQFALSVNLTDPTTAPSRAVEAQFYRAHKDSLPVIKAGDSVLLRSFEVVSMTNKGFGLRTHEESGYAVIEQESGTVQINGPPVEDLDTETEYVATLKQWYNLLDSSTKTKIQQASQKLVDATPQKKK